MSGLMPMKMGWLCQRLPSFPKHCFPFFLTKDEDLTNDLKHAVTALRCTAKHSTQFYTITIYLFLPHCTFWILLGEQWGEEHPQ